MLGSGGETILLMGLGSVEDAAAQHCASLYWWQEVDIYPQRINPNGQHHRASASIKSHGDQVHLSELPSGNLLFSSFHP